MFVISFIIVGGVSIYFAIKIVKGYINSPIMRLIWIEEETIKYIYNRKYERLKYIRLKSDSELTRNTKTSDKNIPNIKVSITGTPLVIAKRDNSCNIEGEWKFKKLGSGYNDYKCFEGRDRGNIGDGWSEIYKIQEYFPTHKYEHNLREMLDGKDILTITSKDSYFKNNIK